MTVNEAYEEGLKVVAAVAVKLYSTNVKRFRSYGMDLEDLKSHFISTVLIPKYITTVETNPDFYTARGFGLSLYTACMRSGWDVIRATNTEKRSCRELVSIDEHENVIPGAQEIASVDKPSELVTDILENIPESDHLLWKTAVLVGFGRCQSKSAVRKVMSGDNFGVPREKLNTTWKKLQRHAMQHAPAPISY